MVATSDHMIRLGRDKTFDPNAVIHDPVQLTSMLQELVTRINFRHVRGFRCTQLILESHWSDEDLELYDLIQTKVNPNRWDLNSTGKTSHNRHYLKLFDTGVPKWSETFDVYTGKYRISRFKRMIWLINRDGKLFNCEAYYERILAKSTEIRLRERSYVVYMTSMREVKWDDKKLLEEISKQPAETRAITVVQAIQSATIETVSALNSQIKEMFGYERILRDVTASLIEAEYNEELRQLEKRQKTSSS